MLGEKQTFTKQLQQAQKVLVGIGEEFHADNQTPEKLHKAYENLTKMLEGKDYFVITLLDDESIHQYGLDPERIFAPGEDDKEQIQEQWKRYQTWLGMTLNRETMLVEAGVSFFNPSLIRWPFEKTAMLNNKAYLWRVHGQFWQLTDEIKDKGYSIKENAVDFMADL